VRLGVWGLIGGGGDLETRVRGDDGFQHQHQCMRKPARFGDDNVLESE
jgi:hypothetical protein